MEAHGQQQIGAILRRLRGRDLGDRAGLRVHAEDGLAEVDGQQGVRSDEAHSLRRCYLVGEQLGLLCLRVPAIDLVHRCIGEEEMALIVSGQA